MEQNMDPAGGAVEDSDLVPTVTVAAAAAQPCSAVLACAAASGDPWETAILQSAPHAPWAPTAGTGLASTVEAGGVAAAVVPQAATGQPASLDVEIPDLPWPCGAAADASFDGSSVEPAEQAQPSAPDPSTQLLLFHQMLMTLPERQAARHQGSAATFHAPPRLAGVGLLGCAASSSPLHAGESSPLPVLAVPLAARESTAAAAATAAATGPAAAAAAATAAVPLGEAFQGGGSLSLFQPQPHDNSAVYDADGEIDQQDGAARAAHAETRRNRKKRVRQRDCLSRTVAKAAQALETTCMEIEQEVADIERGREEETALEQLLGYQEHLVQAVEQQEGGVSLQIPAEALRLLKQEDVSKAFPLDSILRYPVAGDTGQLGPDGRINKVPAFSKVLEDWRQIVGALKQLVVEALESGRAAQEGAEQEELGRACSSLFPPKGVPWDPEGSSVFGSSSQQQQQQEQRWQQLLQSSAGSRPAPANTTPSAEVKRAVTTAVKVAAALGRQSPGRAASEGSVVGGQEAVAESEGPTSASEGPSFPPEADSLRPSWEAEVHVRRMLVLDRLRGHKHATTADGRLVVPHQEGTHVFSEGQLKELAQLLFRLGLLLWQQVLLCPDNFGRLASRRLDVGPEGDEAAGAAQCSGHWEGVVASLELEPQQALDIVQLYREYCDKLQVAKKNRAAAAEAVQQVQVQLESLSLELGRRSQAALELQRAAGALAKCSLKEHLPYVVFVYSVYRVLNFPLQRAKLFTSSWPYFPQLDWIATLAARQIGLDTMPSHSGGTGVVPPADAVNG